MLFAFFVCAIDAGIHAIRAGRHLCDEALRYLWTGTSRRTHSAHAGHETHEMAEACHFLSGVLKMNIVLVSSVSWL